MLEERNVCLFENRVFSRYSLLHWQAMSRAMQGAPNLDGIFNNNRSGALGDFGSVICSAVVRAILSCKDKAQI